ncbi:XRE family transcriptional regulator [Cellvibrio sp. KY-GH-1]|uniref:helix-turn-helix domain-containing protein n=1 Tax=Cellvibrio sp. KY-GH-1 TaxID=2303332 RepID=UPI001244C035|nr:helix-turn-helix transcriptional regulator [Cellvibrio sp. KY-GH-1]QEY15489.1 XRE family transcriptional regulator [Cellvibrio sp. KY-GH-1]
MKKRRELSPAELEIAQRAMAHFQRCKKDNGLTQSKLADAVGMSQSAIGQYLNGEIPFNLPALILLAKEFGCTLQDLDPDCEHILPITPEEKALIAAYRDMTGRHDEASKKALLQVAELSPAYRVTLEHTAKTTPSD